LGFLPPYSHFFSDLSYKALGSAVHAAATSKAALRQAETDGENTLPFKISASAQTTLAALRALSLACKLTNTSVDTRLVVIQVELILRLAHWPLEAYITYKQVQTQPLANPVFKIIQAIEKGILAPMSGIHRATQELCLYRQTSKGTVDPAKLQKL